MKEFKASENMEKDKLVENVEKKFEEDLKEIKDKLNAEKLSDEFKENLQAKLEAELNKDTSKSKGKIIQFPVITRKLAGICACFVLLFSSCFAFADEIENVIFKIFGDTDRIIEKAIANGNYKEIDMEYVENNGVSIKVDYVVVEDDNLYIAFDILSEEEFDEVYIKDIKIKEQNGFTLYSNDSGIQGAILTSEEENITTRNSIIIYKLTNNDYKFENLTDLKIECNKINIIKNEIKIDKVGLWKMNVNIII